MHELNFISYEESRLEYFRAQKAHCERCLDYWVKALCKGKRGYSQIMLEDKCAAYGYMVNYYEDAINAFGGVRTMVDLISRSEAVEILRARAEMEIYELCHECRESLERWLNNENA